MLLANSALAPARSGRPATPNGALTHARGRAAPQNKNTRGKVQKSHHASKVMFAEKVQSTMLVLHFPDKKDYKLNFVVRPAPPPAPQPLRVQPLRPTVSRLQPAQRP